LIHEVIKGEGAKSTGNVDMVHKVIGYGMDHIQVQNGCCVDGRISNDSFINQPSHFTMNGFIEFMFSGSERYPQLEESNFSLRDCFHYIKGCGGHILCVTIPHMIKDFCRTNNPIDQLESESDILPRVRFFSKGLPGFCGIADIRDGRHLSPSASVIFAREYEKYVSPRLCDAERLGLEYTLTELANNLGFRTMYEAAANIAPAVPRIVEQLCVYLNLFNCRQTTYSLRPMSLTYRS